MLSETLQSAEIYCIVLFSSCSYSCWRCSMVFLMMTLMLVLSEHARAAHKGLPFRHKTLYRAAVRANEYVKLP